MNARCRLRFVPLIALTVGATPLRAVAAVNSWGVAGPDGGRVTNLVADPSDANVLYVSSDAGVFKSSDGGAHWALKISAFTSPGVVLAAGPNGQVLSGYGGYLYLSNDGGDRWSYLGSAATDQMGEGLPPLCGLIDLTDPERYVVGTAAGAYLTTDGGTTWRRVPGPAGVVYGVRQDPLKPSRYYLTSVASGMFRSEDRGATWATANPSGAGAAFEFALGPRPDLLVARFQSAVVSGGHTYYQTTLWKSTDAGTTWTPLAADGIPWFVDENTLVAAAGRQAIFRSTDGGKTWVTAGAGLADLDVTTVVPGSARPQTAFFGTYADGIFRTDDGGLTFTFSSSGFQATYTNDVGVHQSDPNLVLAATRRGLWRSENGGGAWTRVYGYQGGLATEVRAIVPDVGVAGRMLASGDAFARSEDLGKTWSRDSNLNPPSCIAPDPSRPRTVFAAIADVLRRSDDGGATFPAVHTVPFRASGLAVAPGGQVLYGADSSSLFRSSDGGATWARLTRAPDLFNTYFQIAIDPVTPSTIYLASAKGLFKSADDGATFTDVDPFGGATVTAVAIDPGNPNVLYIGVLGAGVYKSRDGGNTWSDITADLQSLEVRSIAVAPSDTRILYVGTLGGVSRLDQIPPRVLDLSPAVGSSIGGTRIAITGENFMIGASVLVGGRPSADVFVKNSTTIEASVPPNAAGEILDVVVVNPTYDSSISPRRFEYESSCFAAGQPFVTAPATARAYDRGLHASVTSPVDASIVWKIDGGWITGGQGTREITFIAGNAGYVVLQASEVHDSDCRTSPGTAVVAIDGSASPSFASERVVPIVLDVPGAQGSRWSTELTLVNRGSTPARAQLVYVPAASLGIAGGGVTSLVLGAGEQRVIPDALGFLWDQGVSLDRGAAGGSLRVIFSGLSAPDAGYASARTTTPSGGGRAGLAYAGVTTQASVSTLWLYGLRESGADRTNIALVNTGVDAAVTLRVTVFSGSDRGTVSLPDVALAPGQWLQLNRALAQAGMAQGYARVDRVAGSGPFFAYAVFNDNATNDGSFVGGEEEAASGTRILPVLVETAGFDTELILTNRGDTAVTATLRYVESLAPEGGVGGTAQVALQPHEQKIVPAAISWLRTTGVSLGQRGGSLAGALAVDFASGGAAVAGYAGARVAAPSPSGGGYGLFFGAPLSAEGTSPEAWIFGLSQANGARSNLALVNAAGSGSVTLTIDVFGSNGSLLGSLPAVTLGPLGWTQVNAILARFGATEGYARVRRSAGSSPFLAYGVVNDNGTNDGSFIPATR